MTLQRFLFVTQTIGIVFHDGYVYHLNYGDFVLFINVPSRK